MIYTFALNPSIDYHLELNELEFGATNRSNTEYYQIGGKGINVAIVLNNLNTQSTLLGFVGGFTGEYIRKELKHYKHIKDAMISVSGTSRINIKMKQEVETEVNAQGPVIDSESYMKLWDVINKMTPDDFVVLSGSLAAGMPKDWYVQVAQRLAEKKVPFIVDIANSLVLELCQYGPFLLKPNRDELGMIFNTTINSEEDVIYYAQQLIEKGAQQILVSLGSQGSMLISKTGIMKAANPDGKVINTVGAGDSMIAGFIHATMNHHSLEEAYRYAVAAGSGTAYSSHLADQAMIESLQTKIKIDTKGEQS